MSLDNYILRDVSRSELARGDTGASVGWAQLDILEEAKREEDEKITVPVPLIMLAGPNFAGIENLVNALQVSPTQLWIRATLDWHPSSERLGLRIEGRYATAPEGMKFKDVVPPIEMGALDVSEREGYERARMYAVTTTSMILMLTESLGGTTLITRFGKRRDSGERKQLYRRIETQLSATPARFAGEPAPTAQ